MPLNGRQFANLAATIPGVGLGFHSDPTKSTQFSPQINGGNGRNINYQIDGGDNNDDTVGGLLQLFPLEAIQEFNFVTSRVEGRVRPQQRRRDEHRHQERHERPARQSFFTMFRNDADEREDRRPRRTTSVDKQDYKPIPVRRLASAARSCKDKIHYFGAFERTQQDTFQAVSTKGLFPTLDGVYATPYRETLVNVKVTTNLNPQHYLSVRYGRNQNSQPYGAEPAAPPNGWGDSKNTFNSINLNHNWVVGGSMLNEFIFQYADFVNHIAANSTDPNESLPERRRRGPEPEHAADHRAEEVAVPRRLLVAQVRAWGGVGHDLKVGRELHQRAAPVHHVRAGKGVLSYTHLDNTLNGPLSDRLDERRRRRRRTSR